MFDTDEGQTRGTLERALRAYGQYHETVNATDVARAEVLGRLGRLVGRELGMTVGAAALPQADGTVRICVLLAGPADPDDDDPEPEAA